MTPEHSIDYLQRNSSIWKRWKHLEQIASSISGCAVRISDTEFLLIGGRLGIDQNYYCHFTKDWSVTSGNLLWNKLLKFTNYCVDIFQLFSTSCLLYRGQNFFIPFLDELGSLDAKFIAVTLRHVKNVIHNHNFSTY